MHACRSLVTELSSECLTDSEYKERLGRGRLSHLSATFISTDYVKERKNDSWGG